MTELRSLALGLVILGTLLAGPFGAIAAGPDASASDRELVLGLRVAPPFVMKTPDGIWTGISVELWRHLAEQLSLRYRFEETTQEGLLKGLRRHAGCLGRGVDGHRRPPARGGFLPALFRDGSRRGGRAACTIGLDRRRVELPLHPLPLGGAWNRSAGAVGQRDRLAAGAAANCGIRWSADRWLGQLYQLVDPSDGQGRSLCRAEDAVRAPAGRGMGGGLGGIDRYVHRYPHKPSDGAGIIGVGARRRRSAPCPRRTVRNAVAVGYLDREGIRHQDFATIEDGLRALAAGQLDAVVFGRPSWRGWCGRTTRTSCKCWV
jgi:polar amino acid transport system substrate-binding protein